MKKIDISEVNRKIIMNAHKEFCDKNIYEKLNTLEKKLLDSKKDSEIVTKFKEKYYPQTISIEKGINLLELQNSINEFLDNIDERNFEITTESIKTNVIKEKIEKIYLGAFKTFSSRSIDLGKISFNDSKFENSTINGSNWSARLFCYLLDVHICPYCNLSVVTTIDIDKSKSIKNEEVKNYIEKENTSWIVPNGTARPTLDHFYPKNKYPFLSMKLYNLVPACSTCNSSIKGKVEYIEELALNPFEDSLDEHVIFTIVPDGSESPYDVLTGQSTSYSINYRPREKENQNWFKTVSAAYMIEFFYVLERYEFHKTFLSNQFKKKVIYSNSYIRELRNLYNINMDEDYYENDENYHQVFLGKLLNDVFEIEKSAESDEEIELVFDDIKRIVDKLKPTDRNQLIEYVRNQISSSNIYNE